jgi:hypothetical protein
MKAKSQQAGADLPLPDEEIREALRRWSAEGFFRSKKLVSQVGLDNVTACRCYRLLLKTEYESRNVSRRSEKVGNPAPEDVRQASSPDIQVDAPRDFENQTREFKLQGSDRIEPCSECQGKGSTTCVMCCGSGKQSAPPCGLCGGSGSRMQTRQVPMAGRGFRTEMVRVSCSCGGFRRTITCISCRGAGKKVCNSCVGSGNVQAYDVLTVEFRCEEIARVVNTTPVPDEMLATVSGETELNETNDATGLANVEPEIQEHAKALLARSRKDTNRSVLRQCLQIDRVHVHQVEYSVAGSAAKRLWICGQERRVYAPGAPKSLGRMLVIAIVTLVAVAALAVLAGRW